MKTSHIWQIVSAVIILSLLITSIIFAKHVKDEARNLGKGASALYEELSLIDTEASLPGVQAMQRTREFLESGDNMQAREKLLFITNFYSDASFGAQARKLLGEMNLDLIFSREIIKDKETYEIQSGDSLSKIADKYDCTTEYIIALNGLTKPNNIQPGQEVMVMPLKVKAVIDVNKASITLLRDGQFLKEYPIIESVVKTKNTFLTTTVKKALGFNNNSTYPRASKSYFQNKKMIILDAGNLIIREVKHPDEQDPGAGFFLSPSDAEELTLLLKNGAPVEIQL